MLLAIDIGNTNIKLALFKADQVLSVWKIISNRNYSKRKYRQILSKIFSPGKNKADLEGILICSVVPKLTVLLEQVLFSLFGKKALVLGRDLTAPIRNLYKKPEQVGQDRLANALAAFNKYAGPTIVVDFGTALTFDLISQKGDYLGGMIVPGMEISLQALIKSAALLPNIQLSRPGALLGKDTSSSMTSGIVYGFSFLVTGAIAALSKEFKKKPRVIATGGQAALIAPFCPVIEQIDEDLTLVGLKIAYLRRKQAKIAKN